MPDAPRIVPLKPMAAAPPRGSSTARGYGWAHRRQRARLIALHPLCQRCGNDWSAHLHHIDRNPHNRADANVEMLCERCHQQEHTK
jgi:5-methylcytosine-specific restriction endonuclease McrA